MTDPSTSAPPTAADPLDMRAAMTEYVRTVHQAYLSASAGQPPGIRGRLTLLDQPFTVAAAAARNLHVIATTQALAPPSGQEVAVVDELPGMSWTLRFFDPVVLPPLGMIEESQGPASAAVRRALGITTHTYHLIVQPGGSLTTHHAGHAGAGLAMDHVADARDYESIRAVARGAEPLVDEMEGAARAGLPRAVALLAQAVAPHDAAVADLARAGSPDPTALRRAVLAAVRAAATPPGEPLRGGARG